MFTFLTTRQAADLRFEHLLVAPFNLREKLTALIQTEMDHAAAGQPAYVLLKINALQDEAMTRLLYRAAEAGVEVNLNIRGICVAVPGGAGGPASLHLRALLDRYLEHGRIYCFANGGGADNERLYLASADWMHRNLSRRVEVAFPIYDPVLKAELRALLELQQHDTVKARDYHNQPLTGQPPAPAVRAQTATYEQLRAAATPSKPAPKPAPNAAPNPRPRRNPAPRSRV